MADVLMYQTPDGGEVAFNGGEPTFTSGLETAVYLSLFGGNERDNGSDGTEHLQWWGNVDELVQVRRYRGETQALLAGIAAIPANLKRVEDAVSRDLEWLLSEGLATAVTVQARMPAPKRVEIYLVVTVDGEEQRLHFVMPWRAELKS